MSNCSGTHLLYSQTHRRNPLSDQLTISSRPLNCKPKIIIKAYITTAFLAASITKTSSPQAHMASPNLQSNSQFTPGAAPVFHFNAPLLLCTSSRFLCVGVLLHQKKREMRAGREEKREKSGHGRREEDWRRKKRETGRKKKEKKTML